MLAKLLSGSIIGIEGSIVEVEVDITMGLPHFITVGLADGAVKESKDRVRSAIKNSGYEFPARKITVNLAPADTKKEGSGFDLPIALGILAASGAIKKDILRDYVIMGELSLDGKIRSVKGVLPMAMATREANLKGMIVPKENAKEGAVVKEIAVFGLEHLSQAVEFLNTSDSLSWELYKAQWEKKEIELSEIDFGEVKGQEYAKRAIEIAATGMHNILMIGPPGGGKTMLAKRIATILPSISLEEALLTTKIHSVMGLLDTDSPLLTRRPFRSPHHTVSDAGLIGGGPIPRPGEISLSHNGVLFLDELPEFKRNALEALRQPIEEGKVTISRASSSITFPAKFMLVAAMNPCPCGYYTDTKRQCVCTIPQILRYRHKISGPLLDRIDIHIEVPSVPYKEISSNVPSESSSSIRERIEKAREVQSARYKGQNALFNSRISSSHIKRYCSLDEDSKSFLGMAMERLGLSARSYTKILKVARTIADLDGKETILAPHISEAIQYRTLDRKIY